MRPTLVREGLALSPDIDVQRFQKFGTKHA